MAMLLTLVLGAGCLLLFYTYDLWKRSQFTRRGIKSAPSIPIIGSYELFQKGFVTCMQEYSKSLGKLYGMTFLGDALLVIGDADFLREIQVRQFESFTNRRSVPTKDYPTNKAVSIQRDERWKEVRNTLTPAFSANKMKRVSIIVNDAVDQLVDHFGSQKNQPFIQCKEVFGSYAMDVVATAFFGLQVDSQKNKDDPFVKHAKAAFNFSLSNPNIVILALFPSLGKIYDLFDVGVFPRYIRKFFIDVVDKTVKMRRENNVKGNDILQLMLDAHDLKDEKEPSTGNDIKENGVGQIDQAASWMSKLSSARKAPMEMDEITANSMIFFIAGYETTNTALCFSCYCLATNPGIQDRLIQEVDEKAPTRDDVTYDIMSSMEYLDAFVMEVFRYYPPAAATDRKCTKDCTYNGFTVKAGDGILVPIIALHHDPDYWPEPEKFDPERFLKENRSKHHPLAWQPFGYGPRNCIGMRLALIEIKFAIVRLLQKYRFQTCQDTVIPPKLRSDTGFIMPKDGIKLQVVDRSK